MNKNASPIWLIAVGALAGVSILYVSLHQTPFESTGSSSIVSRNRTYLPASKVDFGRGAGTPRQAPVSRRVQRDLIVAGSTTGRSDRCGEAHEDCDSSASHEDDLSAEEPLELLDDDLWVDVSGPSVPAITPSDLQGVGGQIWCEEFPWWPGCSTELNNFLDDYLPSQFRPYLPEAVCDHGSADYQELLCCVRGCPTEEGAVDSVCWQACLEEQG